jgi:hypothetical protein
MVKDKTIKLFHRRKRNVAAAEVPEPEPYELVFFLLNKNWRWLKLSCMTRPGGDGIYVHASGSTYLAEILVAASVEVGTA